MISPQAILLAMLVALVAGFAGGWQTRTWKAEAEAALLLRDERDARARAEASLAQGSTAYEQARTDAERRLYDAQATIRELYRARPRPKPAMPATGPQSGSEAVPDCAPPDGARELLIGLGAHAAAPAGQPLSAVPDPAGATAPAH